MNNNQSEKKTNELCVAGIICAIFVPLVGLILSIIGLIQSKKRNENGGVLAVVGIVISVVELIIIGLITLFVINSFMYIVKDASHERQDFEEIDKRDKTAFNLLNNACDNLIDEDGNYNLNGEETEVVCEKGFCHITYKGENYGINCDE